ncbi:MAG: hypothetical protein OHK0024_35800 [Thalassobaculales bacterium]
MSEEAAAPAAAGRKKLSIGRIVLFVMLPMMLLIGGAAGVFLAGIIYPRPPAAPVVPKPEPPRLAPVYFDLPELLLTVRSPDGRARILIMNLTVEVDQPLDSDLLKANTQRLRDTVLSRVAVMTIDQLGDATAIETLRQDLTERVKAAVPKAKIFDLRIIRMRLQ